jgi:hypothetical protein
MLRTVVERRSRQPRAPRQGAPSGRRDDTAVNVLGAVLGIVLLLLGIACFPIGFAFGMTSPLLFLFFIVGIVLLSAALPVPVFLLDRLDGRN